MVRKDRLLHLCVEIDQNNDAKKREKAHLRVLAGNNNGVDAEGLHGTVVILVVNCNLMV